MANQEYEPGRYDAALDAIFKRDDIRGVYPEELNEQLVYEAAGGFARYLSQAKLAAMPRIVVGYDARLSSPALALAACRGIADLGGVPVNIGMCSSEEIYFSCSGAPGSGGFDAGIMVTASHNPAQYNGMKFLLQGGAPFAGELLLELRRQMHRLRAQGTAYPDCHRDFRDFMLARSGWDQLPAPLESPLKVVVSAGNGVGALAFRPLAQCLAAAGFQFVFTEDEPDGRFPNGVPNPLLPEFMERLAAQVRAQGAALGIGFDGDADRAGFVDETGRALAPAEVFVSVARHELSRWKGAAGARPVLMRNLCCSQYVLDAFRDSEVDIVNTPVGHGQIKRLMRSPEFASRVVFAGEHSGHYFYPEFVSVDSGTMTALYMLRILWQCAREGRPLSSLFAEARRRYCWSGELNAGLPSREAVLETLGQVWQETRKRFGGAAQRHAVLPDPATNLNRVYPVAQEVEYDPARQAFPDLKVTASAGPDSGWWFVLRPSGNEPKLRLNVETWGEECQERCRELTGWLRGLIGQ